MTSETSSKHRLETCIYSWELERRDLPVSREGIKRKVFGILPDGAHQKGPESNVRHLLCDDVACKVCEQAAQEASQLMGGSRGGGYSFPGFRAPLSHGPCMGHPLHLDTADSFPQSASAPAPISEGAPLTPTRLAPCGRPRRAPSFPAEDRGGTFSDTERVSEGSRGSSRRSGHLVIQEEETNLFLSTTHETLRMSWTESASDLSEVSVSSLEGGRSCRCLRDPRKRRRDSSWVKSSAESQTSGRDTESFFLRMRVYSQSSPSEASHGRGHKAKASQKGRREEVPYGTTEPSSSRAQDAVFTAADISFLDKAVVASLESHLLGKRLQHLLGLPPALLRSLRGFVPSAPRPEPQRGPVGVTVVPCPQGLSFVAESARKRLELHLKKMIQTKHWQMPRRAQEAIRHMKPPSQPREMAALPPKKGVLSSPKRPAKESCSALSCARKQQILQRNLAKRALEMQLGMVAPKLPPFRKASTKALKAPLPKVIPPGLRPLEPRSQQIHFLDQQALGHIQLNITHKKLSYCLGLPSLYHRSLAQLFPDAAFPAPTFPLPRRSAAFSFASTQIRFLCLKAREELEWHVRRKTLQHAWGLPGLVQRSLQILLSTCRQVRPRKAKAGVVVISTPQVSFLSRAIQAKLEKNLQKRIVHQRWQLPQRVLDSIKLLYPQGQLGNIMGPKPGAVGQQRRLRAQRMVAAAPPQFLPAQLAKTEVILRLHLAKKSLEVHLEVLPAAVRISWRYRLLVLRRPLPKMIHPGHKPLLPRRPLPLSGLEQMSRIEVAVKCSHLASLWGLGTRYAEALRAMRSPGLPRRRRRAFTFSGVQVAILPQAEAEALERHISRKRLQHEWGFPGLVQRSLRYLVGEPPSLVPLRQTGVSAHILVPDLFLQPSFRNRLELHVQKMKLQRLWGLPRRVVESLRMFRPELKAAHQQKSMPRKASPECLPVTSILGNLCTVCRKRKQVTVSRGFPGLGNKNLEKIRVHSAKKSMEVHWEVFPSVAVSSWRRMVLMSRQPLPKRVLRGTKPLQPRNPTLPFVPAEDTKKIDVCVQRYRLSCLWGLGQRYLEVLAAMGPAPHPQPPRYRKASLVFSQAQTLFLQEEDRESLEQHVRKKKLQHEWGFPVSVQSSLRAFVQGPLPGQVLLAEASCRRKVCVRTLHEELLFLPRNTRRRLEHHIQRLKLQRQWALPRRILESMQLLFPEQKMLPAGSSRFGASAKPWSVGAPGVKQGREKGRRIGGAAAHSAKLRFPLEGASLERLQLHVTKKSLEVHLGAFPAVPRRSRQRASLSLSQALPRLIRPGLAPPKPRSSCLLFSEAQMGQIEVAVQHSYLVSLWGLGTRYVEAVAAMVPQAPFRAPVRRRGPAFEFLAVETLFFHRLAREDLELHIRKKRVQHLWEFPALVQRSLWSFMQGPPRLSSLPKSSIRICVLRQELLFLPRHMCRLLEFHILRRKLQRRWGLPQKVLDSLKLFLSAAAPGRALLPQSRMQKRSIKAEASAAGSRATDVRRRKIGSVPLVKKQCLESSTSAALETHLKKKALESKFQLMVGHKAPAGPVRRAPLPKPPSVCSGVRPRRPLLPFVEQEALLKIQLNIKQKHLTYLWGLPSLQVKSLAKMYGKVPGLPGKVATVGSSAKVPGREIPKGPVATDLKPWRWGASFLTQEASDLLEMHILRKKLQRKWGLPATIQKSLSAFRTSPSKMKRFSPRAVAVRVVTTHHLLFLDPVTVGSLEAHVKSRAAIHRWGLPRVVKKFLPPGSVPQGDLAQIPPHTSSKDFQRPLGSRGQGLQAAASPPQADQTWVPPYTYSKDLQSPRGQGLQAAASSYQRDLAQIPPCICNEDLQAPLGARGQGFQAAGGEDQSPWDTQVEGGRPLRPRAGRQPSELSPGGMHPETSQPGREAPKTELDWLPVVTICLTDEAREYLEFHVKRKRVQHDWGLPSTVQKSLRAFAPPPPELQAPAKARAVVLAPPEKLGGQGKGAAATHPLRSAIEAVIPRKILRFLCPNVKDCLETHVKRWATEHRWGVPKMVQRSVRAALPAQQRSSAGDTMQPVRLSKSRPDSPWQQETHSHSEGEEPRGLLHSGERRHPARLSKHHRDSSLQRAIHSHSEGEEPPGLHAGERRHSVRLSKHHRNSSQQQEIRPHPERGTSLVLQQPSKKGSPQKPKGHQRKQWPARNVGTAAKALPTPKPLSLPEEALQLLEFHIIHKRIQHAWATPSILQKSLNALAPFALRQRGDAPKTHRRGGAEVRTVPNDLLFLNSDIKERLEAHIRTLTTRHRWEIPKRVQQSLRTFLASRQVDTDHYQTSDDNKDSLKGPEGRKRTTKKRKGKRGTAPSVGHEASAFFFPEVRLPFLQHEAQNALELHILRKRLQHAWGLPSAVLRSLQAFSPLPLGSPGKRPPRKRVAHWAPWDEGDLQVVTQGLSFLSPERKEHLNRHLSRMIQKRRWGLPERVQQSLRAFMLSKPTSQPQWGRLRLPMSFPPKSPKNAADSETEGGHLLISGTEGDIEADSMRETKPSREAMGKKPKGKRRRKREAATAPARLDVSTFLPHEVQNALEFHIRRKRLQHAWGLPSTVLRSLQTFAPPPLESNERPPRKSAAHMLPWAEGTVNIRTRGLVFIDSVVKERLEAHMTRLTAGHRWELQKHVQEALRAFRLPRPPSILEMEAQPRGSQEASLARSPFELGSSGQKHQTWQNVPDDLEEERHLAGTPSVISATSLSCERELPFLASHLQDFLEFHIQRKKIQHDWGLPATVQRSVRAFAPVPHGLQENLLHSAGMSMAAAGRRAGAKKGQTGKEVRVGAQQLHFLHLGTKEHLESHIRSLKVGHRWHVPKVVQESVRAFSRPVHGPEEEEEEEEQPSMFDQTLDTSDTPFKTETEQESCSSWDDPRIYHTELPPELGPDSGVASWVEIEEPSLCFCDTSQEAGASWKAGREAPRRSQLHEKPLQGSGLKKQRSRIPGRMQEPGVSPLSQPTRRPQTYAHGAGRRLERNPSSHRVRYTCGRITHLAARSSSTSLGKKKRRKTRVPWQPDGSFEEMPSGSPFPADQLPLLSEGSDPGPFLGESIRDASLLEQEVPEEDLRPLQGQESMQQSSLFGPQWTFTEQPYAVESQSSYEDVVARNYRMAGRIRQVKSRSSLRMGGRKVCWGREKRVNWPSQTTGDANWATETGHRAFPATGGLGRWSSETLCQECLSLKSPSFLGVSEEDSAGSMLPQEGRSMERDRGILSNSPKDSEWLPTSPDEGFLGTEGGSSSPAAPGLPPQTDDDEEAVEGREERTSSLGSEEQRRPVSMGSMSQFSTECEWEEIGDWGSQEGGFESSGWLIQEEVEEGGSSSGSSWPRAGREASGSRRHENSPTDSHSLASQKEERSSQTALLWETRFVLSNMAAESASEPLTAPRQVRAEEATGGHVSRGRPPSPATSRGSGERGRYLQLAGKTPSDEKVTLLSQILERKLSLDQGLQVLRHHGERRSK